MSDTFRNSVIKLAFENPTLRKPLVDLLMKTALYSFDSKTEMGEWSGKQDGVSYIVKAKGAESKGDLYIDNKLVEKQCVRILKSGISMPDLKKAIAKHSA